MAEIELGDTTVLATNRLKTTGEEYALALLSAKHIDQILALHKAGYADLPPEERGSIPEVCGSLREALENLDKDRAFLKKGGVMDDDFIDAYIELKMEEVMRLQLHPHPVEFDMYYSC